MKKPNNDAFREWHRYSRVKQLVYHATVHEFDRFDTSKSDLGAHFGNLQQANNIVEHRLKHYAPARPFILPVWINLTNPLRLVDTGSFHADAIAIQLEKKKLLAPGVGKRIVKEVDANWRLRMHYDAMLRKVMVEAGYDGIVYANTAENEGPGDSYVVFEPDQVCFALTNEYNAPAPKQSRRLRP